MLSLVSSYLHVMSKTKPNVCRQLENLSELGGLRSKFRRVIFFQVSQCNDSCSVNFDAILGRLNQQVEPNYGTLFAHSAFDSCTLAERNFKFACMFAHCHFCRCRPFQVNEQRCETQSEYMNPFGFRYDVIASIFLFFFVSKFSCF